VIYLACSRLFPLKQKASQGKTPSINMAEDNHNIIAEVRANICSQMKKLTSSNTKPIYNTGLGKGLANSCWFLLLKSTNSAPKALVTMDKVSKVMSC